jgi:hypothetical protein
VADFLRSSGDRFDFRGFVFDDPDGAGDGFRFVGGAAFSGEGAEIRRTATGFAVDSNGDGLADMVVTVTGAAVQEGDFLF